MLSVTAPSRIRWVFSLARLSLGGCRQQLFQSRLVPLPCCTRAHGVQGEQRPLLLGLTLPPSMAGSRGSVTCAVVFLARSHGRSNSPTVCLASGRGRQGQLLSLCVPQM